MWRGFDLNLILTKIFNASLKKYILSIDKAVNIDRLQLTLVIDYLCTIETFYYLTIKFLPIGSVYTE